MRATENVGIPQDTCAPSLPRIPDHLNEVCWAIDALDASIERLSIRLEPVLGPMNPSDSNVQMPTLSQTATTLAIFVTRVRDAVQSVDRLIEALDF